MFLGRSGREWGTDLHVTRYNCEFRDNRHRQLHTLFPGVKEILPYFLRFWPICIKLGTNVSIRNCEFNATQVQNLGANHTTRRSSLSTYTPYHWLHCICTYHTSVFSLRTHTTPASSLSAYTHTHTHTHRLHSLRKHRTTVFTVYVHITTLSSLSS